MDWHDYGARFYDSQLGRWHVVDGLSHEMMGISPYAYVFNNPLKYIDPLGLYPERKATEEEMFLFNAAKAIATEVYSSDDGPKGIKFIAERNEEGELTEDGQKQTNQFISDIKLIGKNKKGIEIFNTIAESEVRVNVKASSGGFFSDSDKAKFSNTSTFITGFEGHPQLYNIAHTRGWDKFLKSQGITVRYAQIFNFIQNDTYFSSPIILIHELQHAADLASGWNYKYWKENRKSLITSSKAGQEFRKLLEIRSIHAENYLRVQNGDINIRRHYGGVEVLDKDITWEYYKK